MATTEAPTDRGYGARLVAIEPGGAEYIPLAERHGSPRQLLFTFLAPNMEFATVGVGILGPLVLGLSFWQTFWAIILGVLLGAGTTGVLAAWGPGHGLPQMVISRSAFGFLGNAVPAALNTVLAGVGWFAVNAVSGALALHVLAPSIALPLCLAIVVVIEVGVAFLGHNLVQALNRYAGWVLAVIFIAASIWVLFGVEPGAPSDPIPGAFTIQAAAVFGFAAGWNTFASDYSRYFPPTTPRSRIGAYASAGIALGCIPLMVAGAAVITAGQSVFDPSAFTNVLPWWFGHLTLVAVLGGSVAANAMNLYSGSISFTALGLKLPTRRARAFTSLALGALGAAVSFWALKDAAASYTNFLLIIAYTIGPWLGVVFTDRLLRRGRDFQALLTNPRYVNWAGVIAYLIAAVGSVVLFANQHLYTGLVVQQLPGLGDLTVLVGFLLAAGLYYVLVRVLRPALSTDDFLQASLTSTAKPGTEEIA
ncbi:cytosine permease [Mycolicibacterium sp. P9-22]|nr:cytosine permease [Mycolicibacterium sp. P9-22]